MRLRLWRPTLMMTKLADSLRCKNASFRLELADIRFRYIARVTFDIRGD
jgi:hypothetical protein